MLRSHGVVVALAVSCILVPATARAVEKACHPPPKKCRVKVELTGLGTTLDLVLETHPGSGIADVNGQAITWVSFEQEGSHSLAGAIRVTLDLGRPSAGELELPTLPTLSTMRFFWRIETDMLGTFVSVDPAVMSGVIEALPPPSTVVYNLQQPVAFHRVDDPLLQPALILQEGTFGGEAPRDPVAAKIVFGRRKCIKGAHYCLCSGAICFFGFELGSATAEEFQNGYGNVDVDVPDEGHVHFVFHRDLELAAIPGGLLPVVEDTALSTQISNALGYVSVILKEGDYPVDFSNHEFGEADIDATLIGKLTTLPVPAASRPGIIILISTLFLVAVSVVAVRRRRLLQGSRG